MNIERSESYVRRSSEGSEKVSTRADQTNMDLAYEAIQTDIITDKYLRCLCELGYFLLIASDNQWEFS